MTLAGLAPERLEVLAGQFGGVLVGPADATYDELRSFHNGLIDKAPALVACCRGTADVVAAVRFAVGEGLELAVRGGGHNVSGRAVSNGGLVVDMSLMRGVEVDAVARTARVQGGALWSDVNRETGLHGLAVTGGAVSSTGVGGFTLGGGLGGSWASTGWRPTTCWRRRWCSRPARSCAPSPDAHEDLFWALRGGGGNFGVVTSFVFALHPVAEIVGGLVAHPITAAREMLAFYADFTAGAPDELTASPASCTRRTARACRSRSSSSATPGRVSVPSATSRRC